MKVASYIEVQFSLGSIGLGSIDENFNVSKFLPNHKR